MKLRAFFVLLTVLFSFSLPALAEDANAPDANAQATPEETPEASPEMTPEPAPEETPGEEPEEVEIEEETREEIIAMQIAPGAKVRLIQLELSVKRHILRAEKVAEYIAEKDANADTSGLEAILAELTVLAEEISAVEPLANDEETVKQFVGFKRDAIDLVKQFREESKEFLDAEDRQSLVELFKEIDYSELNELRQSISDSVKEYNAQRVQGFFKKIGEQGEEFAQKIRAGEMTMAQVKAELGKRIRNFKTGQMNNAFKELKESNQAKRAFQQAKVLAAKKNALERQAQRIQARIEKIKNDPRFEQVKNKASQWIQKRLNQKKPANAAMPGPLAGQVGGGA